MAFEYHFASSSATEGAATDMLPMQFPSIPAVRPLEETLGSSARFACTAELAPGMSLACVVKVSNGRKEGVRGMGLPNALLTSLSLTSTFFSTSMFLAKLNLDFVCIGSFQYFGKMSFPRDHRGFQLSFVSLHTIVVILGFLMANSLSIC